MGCTMMTAGLGGWGVFSAIVPLVVLGLVIAGGMWLARRLGATRAGSSSAEVSRSGDVDSARDVPRHDYAAGEIDDEEFERPLVGRGVH
jgi:uncharacterized membrane protein